MSDNETKQMLSEINALNKKSDTILTLLQGDDFGNKGLVMRVHDIEKDTESLKRTDDRITWTVWVLISILTLIGGYFTITL